ncbi:hypothetical protein GF322_02040 [Candidatus Dependentiae bacterium]|nr:hypothetical protein [Candidatus Dependentiae bacterium]
MFNFCKKLIYQISLFSLLIPTVFNLAAKQNLDYLFRENQHAKINELSVLQDKIDSQIEDILNMFDAENVSKNVETVPFTDFLVKQDLVGSDVSKEVSFFSKLFGSDTFEKILLDKLLKLKQMVNIYTKNAKGNVTFIPKKSWQEFETFLDCYLKFKLAKDAKSKLTYIKQILLMPLKHIFSSMFGKTNYYSKWILDKCIRLSIICLLTGIACGSYHWLYTDFGFFSGFIVPFNVVKNLSMYSYSLLKYFHEQASSKPQELSWELELHRKFGAWLWSWPDYYLFQ